MSVEELAQRINRSRTAIYGIFERESIDINLLISISEALNYNFIENIYLKNASLTKLTPTYLLCIEIEEKDIPQKLKDKINIKKMEIVSSK